MMRPTFRRRERLEIAVVYVIIVDDDHSYTWSSLRASLRRRGSEKYTVVDAFLRFHPKRARRALHNILTMASRRRALDSFSNAGVQNAETLSASCG